MITRIHAKQQEGRDTPLAAAVIKEVKGGILTHQRGFSGESLHAGGWRSSPNVTEHSLLELATDLAALVSGFLFDDQHLGRPGEAPLPGNRVKLAR